MLFEGTGLYFWLLFLVFLLVYIVVKISLGSLLKRMREKAWKGYVPFYSTFVLVKKLGFKSSLFYKTLIPFGNLYYYNIIIKKMLEVFAQNTAESIWYIVIPMYKFPELVFKNPIYVEQNNYDLTNEFIAAQNVLFNEPKDEPSKEIGLDDINQLDVQPTDGLIINPTNFQQDLLSSDGAVQKPVEVQKDPSQISSYINSPIDNVYENNVTDDELNKVRYVEAKPEAKKVEKPIISPLDQGKEKVCPKCGTRLSSTATACFMCGTVLE